ncbi:MAG: hypothetical protein KIT67_30020 [Alphaproteobacteria bacterium]|nr:hypothetical protein [Alphaproteobacteria bacterium]
MSASVDSLKDAKPSGLLTRFELLINQRTALALGKTIPRAVLLRADAAIE